jgi:uncharacterized protein YjbJ (UPF0337 family)
MTEDRARGQIDQVKGVIKEKTGKITGDRSTELSGKVDQAKGKIESRIGKTKDAIRNQGDRSR